MALVCVAKSGSGASSIGLRVQGARSVFIFSQR